MAAARGHNGRGLTTWQSPEAKFRGCRGGSWFPRGQMVETRRREERPVL